MSLSGKHAFITGGARGIGLAIAEAYGRDGAIVSIADSHAENLEHTVRALRAAGTTAHGHVVDVTDQEAVIAAVAASERLAPIDVLVNDAGIAYETSFLDISADEWRRVLDVNLTGMFFVAQAVARHMVTRRRGVILNMASKNGD